jgi:hypothetical protein
VRLADVRDGAGQPRDRDQHVERRPPHARRRERADVGVAVPSPGRVCRLVSIFI